MRKTKMLQKTVDDLTISLMRMNRRVGGLEARVGALEKEMEDRTTALKCELEARVSALTAELEKTKTELDGDTMSNQLQEGIDSIIGYQWPPAKGGKK